MKKNAVNLGCLGKGGGGGGNPLVSIIVPVYNAEKYLRECLDSIVNQTYSNVQIICIDDGSTDNCPAILDEYAHKDERFNVIHQQNTGQGIAKFNAFPLIRGKYTMTADADDWIDLDTIEKCIRIAQEKDADVVVFTPDKRYEDGTKNDAETADCLKWQFAVSVNEEGIATDKPEIITTYSFWGKLFLTELLLKNFTRPGNRVAEDCVVLWQVIPAAQRIVFLPDNLYHYRIVGSSCCNTRGRHHLDSLNNCRIIYEELVKRGQFQEYEDCFLRFLLSAVACNFYKTLDEDRYEFLRQFRALLTREMRDFYRSAALIGEHRRWLKRYKILENDDAVFGKHIEIALAEDDICETKEKIRKLKGRHKPVKTVLVDTARRIARRIFGAGTVGNFILRVRCFLGKIKKRLIYLFSNERVAYRRFLSDKVRPHSVLLIEPNECHGVVIPGYAKYLSELGYNVDILMTTEEAKLGAASMLAQPQYRQYVVTWENMRDIIEKQIKYADYAVWFFTSGVIYNWKRSQCNVWCTVSERFPNIPLDKTVFVSHHKEYNDSESLHSNCLIMLADFLEGAIVVPHYFGKADITPKNDVTQFFVVGTVHPNRRNFSLLFSAVEKLAKQQQRFTVTAVGEGFEGLQIPQSIRKFFNFAGKIPYPDMYRKLEDADYFLPLLDPDKPEHNRYITEGTSGNFLLIYGFRKPMVIARKFALPHHLTEDNAVLYETNTELADAMLKAMSLNQEQYQTLQNNLAKTADDIYDRSLNNLRRVMNGIEDRTFFHHVERWKHHNESEYLKKHNPPHIPNDRKIKIFYYDTYLANSCNLKCVQCCHFSPFRTNIPSKEFLISSYEEWSKRIEPEVITVGGGEPLLHTDLLEVILAMRRYFPNPLIQIITNGLLLPKLPDYAIKQLCDAGRIIFRVSKHLDTPQFNELIRKEENRFAAFGVPLYVHNSYSWWRKFYCSDESGAPIPAGSPHLTADKCYGKIAFYGKNVFYCCLIANAYNAVQEGVLGGEWDFLQKYKPITLASTQQEIFDYLTQSEVLECMICPEDQAVTRIEPCQLTAGAKAECAMCPPVMKYTLVRQLSKEEIPQ